MSEEGFGATKFLPTLIGGYIMAIMSFPLFYYGFYYFIEGARKAKTRVGSKVHDIADRHADRRKNSKENKKDIE